MMSTAWIYCQLPLIEPWRSRKWWLDWFNEEVRNLRRRFPINTELDLRYWPDDYYARMENWWATDNRNLEPLALAFEHGKITIEDGWHRVAISHKLGLEFVPATFPDNERAQEIIVGLQ